MKKLILTYLALVILCTPAVLACNTGSGDTQAQTQKYIAIQEAIEAAKESGDAEALEIAEGKLREWEAEVLNRRAGPIIGLIATAFPPLAPLLPAVIPAIPLLGSRGRKHYWNALKASLGGDVVKATKSTVKAFGLAHSSEASKAAAAQEIV